jgi:DNA-binding beta-propeller fold protein YncE
VNSRPVPASRSILLILGGLALALYAVRPASAQTATGATFGDVVSLAQYGGTPSDIVLDESRHVLYLIGNNTSTVYVYDYTTGVVTSQIALATNAQPLAGAISMDGQYLYVTCSGTSTLDVIFLNSRIVTNTVALPSKPQGVEVGADGTVLVALAGTVTSGVPAGTLAVYDPSATALLPVSLNTLASTPVTVPTVGTVPSTTFVSKLLRTPNGQYIVGAVKPTNANVYLFVYEVASKSVLLNRTFASNSTVLSMAPDGSRFMAGLAMFDIGTLNLIAQQNIANAPFPMSNNFNTQSQIGGSTFSADGSTLYSAFNVAATATPAPPSNSSTLLASDPLNLGIHLGIKLPENIIAKIVQLSDGSQALGLSDSGMVHLPLGNLYNYPILAPETTEVFLAMDDCNRGLAQAALQINNLGKGKLTFSVASGTNAALESSIASGVAPSTITFTMDPGRSGVTRQAGTNLFTGAATSSGTPLNVTLSSAEAINIPNTIRVYMNYRQSDQRGVIYPIPTAPNSNSGGITMPAGNEGLQDLLLDPTRGLLYITNSGYNRLEIFDTKNLVFLPPIPVGQLPHQMAMTSDDSMLYVANAGGESISLVDLNLQQVVGNVIFPPIPRNGTVNPIFARSIALGLNGLEFVMSDGSQWEVVNGIAIPRPANTVTPNALSTTANLDNMIASTDGQYILTLSGNGNAYVYNSTGDTYTSGKTLFGVSGAAIQGFYGPLGIGPAGSYLLANGLILNASLATIGGSATPSASSTSGVARNVAAIAPVSNSSFLYLTTPIRASITATGTDDQRTTLLAYNLASQSDTLVGVVPENPVATVFGTTRQNLPARQMVVDPAGTTAYAITLSGLSVIPLAPTSQSTLPAISSITNATGASQAIQPGSFVTIKGQNLAATAVATTIPPPTVLGGSCVTFGNVSLPLLSASPTQIQAQVPDNLLPGTQLVEVRSLANAQDSAAVTITVRSGTASTIPGSSPVQQSRRTGTISGGAAQVEKRP